MKIHHIGYVVKDLDKFKKNLPIYDIVNEVYDEFQKARMVLLKADNIYIELIQPKEGAFTYNFLKNEGYHHLCYEVDSKEIADNIIKTKKMIKVLDWVYAPLLDMDVMFAYNKNKEIVEFACQKKLQ